MNQGNKRDVLDEMKKLYPKKFTGEDIVFSNIHRGNRIFIGTGCGEPRYLIRSLVEYTKEIPRLFLILKYFMSGLLISLHMLMKNTNTISG